MACFWKPLLPLVTWVEVCWLKPWPFAHSIFLCHLAWIYCGSTDTWLSLLVDWWITGYGFQELIPSNGYSLVMVWFWRWMVLPSCLLDDGHWILVILDWSLLIHGLSDHPLELGGPGLLSFPGVASSLDPGLSAIWHWLSVDWHRHFSFFFLLRCAVTHFIGILHFVVIIMFAVVFYMIVLLLCLCVLQDDIYFRQFIIPPPTAVAGGIMFYCWSFILSSFFFRHRISKMALPTGNLSSSDGRIWV